MPLSEKKALALVKKGHFAFVAGDMETAIRCYVEVLNAYPTHPIALHDGAIVAMALADRAKAQGKETLEQVALDFMAMAVAGAPNNPGALHNFGKFLQDRGRLEEAKHLYTHAVAIKPDQGESWLNLGNVYGELGNRIRSEGCWQTAMECPRSSSDAKYNLSFLSLRKGDYATGWPDYEFRLESPVFHHNYGRPDLTAPKWDGAAVDGPLYLHQEQGAGDALMMARYVPLAQARTETVVLEVISGLVPLMQATFPGIQVVTRGHDVPSHAAQCSMMSLPAVLGTTLETIPEPAPIATVTRNIAYERGRVGLCWRGSTTHTNDRVRSMPFEATFSMLDVPGLAWQSLQFGYDVGPPMDPCPTGDFLDTAKAIAQCELVVTVDTSVAHLAGSMGVETWLLVPFVAEWRWLDQRPDSPWYPSMTIWRQSKAGDWHELCQRVANALRVRFTSNDAEAA